MSPGPNDPQSEQGVKLDPKLEDNLNLLSGVLPIEFIPVPEREPLPGIAPYLDKIIIFTIHGGDVIPEEFYGLLGKHYPSESKVRDTLLRSYCIEKDWGANQVAAELAEGLGLAGYWRVNIARTLLDFGRLPGSTPPGASHLDRYAINYPFSSYLDVDGKRLLLEAYFDKISAIIEKQVEGKVLTLGIHSYDHRNPTLHYTERGTVRPEVSLIFRSTSFQKLKRMPRGLFDPLYANQLAESTADRRLTARISLMLERNGVAVSHNYPYFLPDGSLEVRMQVWNFFRYLRKNFLAAFPETREDVAFTLVWNMLLDTNLRSTASEALRSYLHMFRHPPEGMDSLFRKAQRAYSQIATYVEENDDALLNAYRRSPSRKSSLAIEVRKDLVWRFHDAHTSDPVLGEDGCKKENVRHVSTLLARSIATYFKVDRPKPGKIRNNGFKGWQA